MGTTYNTKDLPELLRAALKAIGYRKRKAIVTIAERCEVYGTNWDSGSRNEYHSFDRDGRPLKQYWQGGDWMRPEPTQITFSDSEPFAIQSGVFRGKAGGAFIYIHPEFAEELGL